MGLTESDANQGGVQEPGRGSRKAEKLGMASNASFDADICDCSKVDILINDISFPGA